MLARMDVASRPNSKTRDTGALVKPEDSIVKDVGEELTIQARQGWDMLAFAIQANRQKIIWVRLGTSVSSRTTTLYVDFP